MEDNYQQRRSIPISTRLTSFVACGDSSLGFDIYTHGSLAPVIILSHASHLFLDFLDSAEYWPFYPLKAVNIRGPIHFFSKQEIILDVILIIIFLIALKL